MHGALGLIVDRLERLDDTLDKQFGRSVCIVVAVLGGLRLFEDLRRKIWTDEFFTLFIARFRFPSVMIQKTIDGMDGAAPLYAMCVAAIKPFISSDAMSLRIVATVGYIATLLFILHICRKRMRGSYVFLPILLMYDATRTYGSEGRPYGLMMGASAGALWSWQKIAEGGSRRRWLPLLAFCTALMVAAHYYAIFVVGPLVLGELAKTWRTRKLDYAALVAIVVPPLAVVALHLPLIAASKRFQEHFWADAYPTEFFSYYMEVLTPMLAIVALAIAFAAALPSAQRSDAVSSAPRSSWRNHEWAALAGLAVTPVIVVFVASYITHAFHARYVLWALYGISIILSELLYRSSTNPKRVGATLFCMLTFWIVFSDFTRSSTMEQRLTYGQKIFDQIKQLPASDEPIVVENANVYLELAYYAPTEIQRRLIYPLSADMELRYAGFDTESKTLMVLRNNLPLAIMDYGRVLSENPRFILASDGPHFYASHLAKLGYHALPLGTGKDPVLFDMTRTR